MIRLICLSVLAAGLVGCISSDEKPFDPRAMQSLYRDRAVQNVTPPLQTYRGDLDRTYLRRLDTAPATQSTQPATLPVGGEPRRMYLRQLIQLAAANSLDVRVAGYQPAIDEARVTEAEGRFDPVFFTNFNIQNQWVLTPGITNPNFNFGSESNFETAGIQTGFKQTLPTGAQVQLQYQYQRTFQFNTGSTNRSYEGNINFQLTQPLLQNFGTEVNRARIFVARNTQRVSLLDFRLALEKQLSEIEQLYWQLAQAEEDLIVQQELLTATIDLTQRLQQRFAQDATAVDLGQANSALRSREAALVEARTRIRTLSSQIKRRVNDPDASTASPVTILPADQLVATPIAFDLVEQIDTALQNRAELAQQRIRIDSARIVQNAARNNLLPSLNLVLNLGSKAADDLPGPTLRDQLDFGFREYGVGIQLEVPLGNREARAIYRRTQLQQLQAIDQYKSLIEQVVEEVRTSHDELYGAWERVDRTHQSTLAAKNTLDRLVEERLVGQAKLDPNFVFRLLSAQETYAQARREEARAKSEYNVAIAQLERAKGTLLRYDNVMMAEDPQTIAGPRLLGK